MRIPKAIAGLAAAVLALCGIVLIAHGDFVIAGALYLGLLAIAAFYVMQGQGTSDTEPPARVDPWD